MISHQLGATPSPSMKTLNYTYPSGLDRRLQPRSSTMSACSRLPSELLVEIFNWLPPLSHSLDRLSVCRVCRSWLGPAQIVSVWTLTVFLRPDNFSVYTFFHPSSPQSRRPTTLHPFSSAYVHPITPWHLWRSLWLRSPRSVSSLADTVDKKPELAKLPRALRFYTGDNEYLAELDADAVFVTMNRLVNLEQFHVLVNYCSTDRASPLIEVGDLYDSLCEELLGSPVKHIVLGADEGISRSHVQASMRFERLEYLELLRLGDLGDLRSLEVEWVFSKSLVELVLIQPDLPGQKLILFPCCFDLRSSPRIYSSDHVPHPSTGDALRFLLSHVKGTLRRLKIHFGHLVADNGEDGTSITRITEEDLETALVESGADLRHLELCWPYSTTPFLNQTVKGLFSLEEMYVSGAICDPGLIDLTCQSKLERISFDLRAGTEPPKSLLRLVDSGARRSNVTKYHLRTFFDDPSWEQTVLKMVEMRDQEQEIPKKDWSQECIEKWQELSKKLGASGIKLTADFF
ncbi:hypothetical protein VP01_1757g1 [Puccinia sorghi]|uniref:F-box domain-containing protein n=1 Tax=Puccinia sorghi TaxID=27349 RepID=A0A0L6VFJ5_9BASI|nr:hypothetical protein VP01_1757g1 [Puccinia sorghi]